MAIYEKHTNGCSPSSIKYNGDKVEIIFKFMGKRYKKFTLYAEIDDGDGEAYLDFSVIELFEDRLKKAGCNTLYIKKATGIGIILNIGDESILIPAYHHYNYYTSDIVLVIEYGKYDGDKLTKSEIKRIDLSDEYK